jgi:hypothetical protein
VNRVIPALLVATALWLPAPAVAQTAAQISDQDRAALVDYLKTTREQVLAETAKLTPAQWNFKPAPDRWSVGEVVQHLALAEPFIFGMQQKLVAAPPASPEQVAATKGKDEMIRKGVPDRTRKAQAPEPIQPGSTAGAEGQAETLATFQARRAETIEYASTTSDDLRSRVSESPLGPLDAYQWLLFVAAHSERHLGQIKEVKAEPRFPKPDAP